MISIKLSTISIKLSVISIPSNKLSIRSIISNKLSIISNKLSIISIWLVRPYCRAHSCTGPYRIGGSHMYSTCV